MSRPVCASIVFENWFSFAFGVHCITSFQAHCYFKTETGSLELVRKLFGIKWFRLENSIVNRAGDHLSDHGIAEFHEPSSQVMITLRILQYVSFSERFPQLPGGMIFPKDQFPKVFLKVRVRDNFSYFSRLRKRK